MRIINTKKVRLINTMGKAIIMMTVNKVIITMTVNTAIIRMAMPTRGRRRDPRDKGMKPKYPVLSVP